MKIVPNAYNPLQPERLQAKAHNAPSEKQEKMEQQKHITRSADVELSPMGRHLQQARSEHNDVDMDRVNALRAAIADGSFEIDAHRIADGLITSARELLR